MDVFTIIKQRLADFAAVRYEAQADFLRVLPTSDAGFAVAFHATGGAYTVYFNGWHEEFTNQEEALDRFGFGLSSACRLIEYRRGRIPCRWAAQSYRDGEWRDFSVTGLMIVPFWKREVAVILQNHLLKAPDGEPPNSE